MVRLLLGYLQDVPDEHQSIRTGRRSPMHDRVIQQRDSTDCLEMKALGKELRGERLMRLEAQSELARSDDHRDELGRQRGLLGRQVALWGTARRGPKAHLHLRLRTARY